MVKDSSELRNGQLEDEKEKTKGQEEIERRYDPQEDESSLSTLRVSSSMEQTTQPTVSYKGQGDHLTTSPYSQLPPPSSSLVNLTSGSSANNNDNNNNNSINSTSITNNNGIINSSPPLHPIPVHLQHLENYVDPPYPPPDATPEAPFGYRSNGKPRREKKLFPDKVLNFKDFGEGGRSANPNLTSSLYIGEKYHAKNKDVLQYHGVHYILNCTPTRFHDPTAGTPCYYEHESCFKYKRISVYDSRSENVLHYLDEGIRFIEEGKHYGSVLVHCNKGRSRSASFILAYLMAKGNLDLTTAFDFLRTARPSVQPNESFMAQLVLFNEELDRRRHLNQQSRQPRLSRDHVLLSNTNTNTNTNTAASTTTTTSTISSPSFIMGPLPPPPPSEINENNNNDDCANNEDNEDHEDDEGDEGDEDEGSEQSKKRKRAPSLEPEQTQTNP